MPKTQVVDFTSIDNPFSESSQSDLKDISLVEAAVGGDRTALDELIRCHQAWIYNIALRMVWNPQDAEDVTMEVLLKIITKLATFKGESRFRTWVYRIVANHVINMKKRNVERQVISFDQYWDGIRQAPDRDVSQAGINPTELPLMVEEVKIHCMMAMLLCLDRRKRLIFILGEIFKVSDKIGSAIMEISPANFRQILSRSRKLVYGFMDGKCSLVDSNNPCHCHKKLAGLIETGEINPRQLRFNRNFLHRIRSLSTDKYHRLDNLLYSQCKTIFREQPFQNPPNYVAALRELIHSTEFQDIFDSSVTA